MMIMMSSRPCFFSAGAAKPSNTSDSTLPALACSFSARVRAGRPTGTSSSSDAGCDLGLAARRPDDAAARGSAAAAPSARPRDLPRMLLVTGPNMGGKSTFMRAIGTNVVLAQMGAPVRARRLRVSPLVIGATLRVQIGRAHV